MIPFARYLQILFIIFLLFTFLDASFSFEQLTTLRQSQQAVDKATEVKIELLQLKSLLLTTESSQRAYIITGDENTLIGYKQASPQIDPIITHLYALLKGSPQSQQIVTLKKLAQQRLHLLNEGITLRRDEGFEAAQTLAQQGKGRKIMGEVNSIISQLSSNEESVLVERNVKTKNGYRNVFMTIGLAMLFTLGLIFFAYYLIRREITQRDAFEKRKDEFISTASHELRTPITSLKMFTQILHKRAEKYHDKDLNLYIDRVDNQAERLTQLIREMLDVSRIQSGKLQMHPTDIDLQNLVEETVDSVSETTKKHNFSIKGTITKPVFADRYRIYQVLVNLLTNAIKYSPKGGKITVSLIEKRQSVQVSIKDQGIGIAKEHRDKIFDRLYQVNDPQAKQFAGLGIGLYVVSEIIKQHGGRIWVDSIKGKGSTFSFTLPLTSSQKHASNQQA